MKARTLFERAVSGNTLTDGDSLVLANICARVTIAVSIDDNGLVGYVITGDLMGRESQHVCNRASDAFNYAKACLAHYMEGHPR